MCRVRLFPTMLLILSLSLLSSMPLVLRLFAQTLQPAPRKALILPLQCEAGDCPLLTGAPQTSGMRSGFVRLKPGASVGWHSTAASEEQLVILHGRGEAQIESQAGKAFAAPAAVYIPPATRHNVTNTGSDLLEYVYVVASAANP